MIFYQVNKFLVQRNLFSRSLLCLNKNVSTDSKSQFLHPLESRKLLKISGDDVPNFLQGLITNDIRHFEEGTKAMYAMFLNNKGRVLYDTLLYKWDNEETFLIECDTKSIAALLRHLKLYKLKKKLDISDVSSEYRLWALIAYSVPDSDVDVKEKINTFKDPRINDLGYRIIASLALKGSDIASTFGEDIVVEETEEKYKYLRYQLGVSEGVDEIPPNNSFPLEANCDYLHGVSFHKGCYIGQELTARVHHTGVVRKRIMPIRFSEEIDEQLEIDSPIIDAINPKTNFGKLKGYIRDCGIGLVRVKEATDAKGLTIGHIPVEVIKPSWWPVEAPKEKLNLKSEKEA